MTTPQDPGKRRKQKIRRTKRLAQWRTGHASSGASDTGTAQAKDKSTSG
jgi:hypothetical protein